MIVFAAVQTFEKKIEKKIEPKKLKCPIIGHYCCIIYESNSNSKKCLGVA